MDFEAHGESRSDTRSFAEMGTEAKTMRKEKTEGP